LEESFISIIQRKNIDAQLSRVVCFTCSLLTSDEFDCTQEISCLPLNHDSQNRHE
jgi:hypothetical protein